MISAIIPSYNPGDKLLQSLASINAAHTDADTEIWVMDGGSTDGVIERVATDFPQVTVVRESDQGIYDAMNKGIDRARGDWFYFLGAGDLVRPGVFDKAQAAFADTEIPAIVYGDVFKVNVGQLYGGEFTPARLCAGHNIPHQALFYHRSVFEMLGRYSLGYPTLADYAFNMRAVSDERITKHHIDEIICDYEGEGASDSRTDEAFFRDYPQMIRDLFGPTQYALYRARMAVPAALKRAFKRK